MHPPDIKTSCGTQNKNSDPMGVRLELAMSHCGNPKMDPPHIKTSCGTQRQNSNPMGIGLRIDYVAWWEILKWIPTTSKRHVGHKKKFQCYGYRVEY